MARDFGGLARPRWRPGQRAAFVWWIAGHAGLLVGFLIFAVLPTFVAISPIGPDLSGRPAPPFKTVPCGRISRAEFDRGWSAPPRTFTFEGVTFARRRGEANCQGRREGHAKAYHPVCEFNVPYQLAVTAGGPAAYFTVPPGETATVEAKPGSIRCAVTGLNILPLT